MDENRKPRPAVIPLERGEKLAGWIYFPFYLVGISFGLSFLFMYLGRDPSNPRNLVYMNLVYGCINVCVLTVCFRRYLRRSLRQLGQFPGRFLTAAAVGTAIYFFGTSAAVYLTELISPGLENINNAAIEEISEYGVPMMTAFSVLLAPIAEELLFRGLIYGSIRPRSRFWAFAASMLAFSALHVLAYVREFPASTLLLCLVQYLPASFGLAWALEHSGSIFAPIAVHMLANAVSMRVLTMQ